MKVLNIIWGFSLGTGIDKCFLTYSSLGNMDDSLKIISVCLNLQKKAELSELQKIGAIIIDVKNRWDFSWLNELAVLIKWQEPELIFAHGFNGAILMLLLRWLKRINTPVICSEHGLYFASTPIKKPLELIYNTLMGFSYRKVAKKLICVDEHSRKYWINKGVVAKKIVTVHNGISKNFSKEKKYIYSDIVTKESKILITVSSLYYIKGLTYLLDAIALVKEMCKVPFEYIVIGTGEDIQFLKNKTKKLKIDDIVHFVGYQKNVPLWLNSADIFILPSLSECHSIALLEAMRAGKGIIATNVGGNPESIRNGINGILIPPKNPEALAGAIKELLENGKLCEQYGKTASEDFLMCFTEEKMKKNLINTLKAS